MSAGAGLTGYDLVIIGFFALLILRGIWLGFLKQVTGLIALYVGYLAAGHYHDRIFPFLKDISTNPKVVFFAAYVILFVAAYVAVMLIGKGLAYVMQLTISGWFDKMLGGLLGAAKALILILVIHMGLTLALPPENKMLTSCRTCNALNKTMVYTLDLIKNKDVKQVFDQQKPPVSAKDVKDFFDTPPKTTKSAADKPSSEKPANKKATSEKAEKQSSDESSSI